MKPTGMPVSKLTVDCIWNSFRSSGKRHLIITGTRGSGKTTLLNALFPKKLPGITTWAKPEKAVYLQENISGKTVAVGTFDASLPGYENKMVPLSKGFATLGVSALMRCMETDSTWISIDEIGYLEEQNETYHDLLRQLLEKKQVAAVIRKQNLPFFQELCDRKDCFVVDLDDPFGNIACVIMASGFGKRFGGNKLIAHFHGKPLISRILDATEGIFPKRIVVTRYDEVAQLCKERGIPTVMHQLPYRSDTIRLGLQAIGETDRCLFAIADQPLLSKETIAALVLASANDPDFIWRTAYEDVQGSPVVFPLWAFPELQNLPEGKGGRFIIKKYPERLRTINVRDIYELKDIDIPEDLIDLPER